MCIHVYTSYSYLKSRREDSAAVTNEIYTYTCTFIHTYIYTHTYLQPRREGSAAVTNQISNSRCTSILCANVKSQRSARVPYRLQADMVPKCGACSKNVMFSRILKKKFAGKKKRGRDKRGKERGKIRQSKRGREGDSQSVQERQSKKER